MLMVNQLAGFGATRAITTPDKIGATLWGWWAPDSMVGTTTLTSWTDKSGNLRTLTPQGSNPDKVAAGGPNGYDAVDLDTASVSGNERLEGGESEANVPSWHLFAVLKIVAYASDKYAIYGDNDGGTSTKSPCWTAASNDRLRTRTSDGGAKEASPTAAVPAAGSWALFEGYVESGVEVGVSVDNTNGATTTIGSVTSTGELDGITLGANGAGSQGMDCTFSELIIYPSHLSTQNRQEVIDYLIDKYGALGSW